MSILIKDMEMPTHCIDCPFMVSRDDDDCILQSAEANASFESWKQMKAGCPLVPVPPHGRLIDADVLHEELYALEYARENEWLDGVREARGVDAARVALLDAPTIIPASGGNEDE